MLINHLALAFRNLRKNRTFSLLHIGGLALGITASLLLWTYVASEWRFNRHHHNLPNLYRVLVIDREGKTTDYTPPALAPWLKNQFPEVVAFARTNSNGEGSVTYAGAGERQVFREEVMAYADGDFFRLFTHPAVAGTPGLDGSQQVVLSATYAKKYFGDESPVGKTLTLNNQFGSLPYTVTGVFEDMPEESDYHSDLLFSLKTLENQANLNGNDWASLDTWKSASYFTFLQLQPGADIASLESKTNTALKSAFPENESEMRLQPLSEVHLGKSLDDPYPTFGNRGLLLALSGVALLILLIAWINYVNLATAQGLQQAKNVSVRRTIGATRWQVAGQYLTESVVLMFVAVLVATLATAALQPLMSEVTGKTISPASLLTDGFAPLFAGVLLLGTVLSGGYVAWLLSGFKPAQTLQGGQQSVFGKGRLRNALIIGQFAVSIAFIIGTLVFQRQLDFMRGRNLGMNIEQLLVLRGPEGKYDDGKERLNTFRTELEKLTWVEQYCFTGCLPGATFQQNFSTGGFSSAFSSPETEKKSFVMALVDHLYQPTYGLKMAAGQNFTPDEARQGWRTNHRLLLNETAARQLGFAEPQQAVGQPIRWNDQPFTIAGVLRDYHHRGLQQAIEPMIFLPSLNSGLISIRTSDTDLSGKISRLQALFAQFFPNDPFDYYFENEDFDKQYIAEKRLSSIAGLAAAVAILLSCLGLLGLITFIIAQRTKEIGIRKVLGASVANITGLLAKDFLQLVIAAFVIASPLANWLVQRWLVDFAYHIELQWWMFAVAGLAAVAVAFLTVSFQSVRAALANPVDSLRSE